MSTEQKYGLESFATLAAASTSFGGRYGASLDPENAQVLIIPVPYDATTTYMPGTRQGPDAILRASQQLELFDEETGQEVFRVGIVTLEEMEVDASNPSAMVDKVRSLGEKTLDFGLFPLMLGGEHLLSLGMIQAMASRVDDLSVLQLFCEIHPFLRLRRSADQQEACRMLLEGSSQVLP